MRGFWLVLISLGVSSLAAATPWFTQDPRTLPQGKWRFEEHVLYSDFNDRLVDGDRVPLAGIEGFSSLTLHSRLRYGVKDNLTVFADVPAVTRRLRGAGGVVTTNEGLGDLLLVAKWKYRDHKQSRSRNAVAVSVKASNGEAEGLPAPLALGSGTTDLSIVHLWEKGMGGTTWYANVGETFTGSRSDLDTNPGDITLFNLAAEHRLGWQKLNFVWEINGRYQGRTSAAGSPVPNTDSMIISLSPGLQYVRPMKGGKLLQLEAGVQVPVITQGDAPALADFTAYAGGYIIF